MDKNLTVRLSGRGKSRPLFEEIARRCHHLVFVRRLATGPSGRAMPRIATLAVEKLFRDFRDEHGKRRDKLFPKRPEARVLPKPVRRVANEGKSGNCDDYLLEEAAIHDARFILTDDLDLLTRLRASKKCVEWLEQRRITVLREEEYLQRGAGGPTSHPSAGSA